MRALNIKTTALTTSVCVLHIRSTTYGNILFLPRTNCFEYPQKSLLKSNYPKKYLPKILYLKISQNREFQTPKNPLHLPVTLNTEYPPGEGGLLQNLTSKEGLIREGGLIESGG